MRRMAAMAFGLVLAACGRPADTGAAASTGAPGTLPGIATTDLPGFFDCVREAGGVIVAAHRGGPTPGYPENALETLRHAFDAGIRVLEVDIATSRDGVLFLLHDRSLGRTTTGEGAVADTDWETISRLKLKDNDGRITGFSPPLLSDVLDWAVATGAVLEIDKKETAGWRSLIRAIEAAGAGNHVILITYTDADAALVQRLAPGMLLTANARGGRDVAALEALGADRSKLVAWTGTEREDEAAWQRLLREGVEPAFGTLGRPGERLDDAYCADGDGAEYEALARSGVILIATDEPYRVAEFLSADDRALNACAAP